MEYFLYFLFFLSCVVLIAAVLLQPGKTDAGALFTSNVSSSAFAPRGTATVLSKITIAAAVVFMLSALLLSMPAISGNVSVLSSNPETPGELAPAADTNTNTADANANVSTDANANSAPAADTNSNANTATAGNTNANSAAANSSTNANASRANTASNANADQ